MHDDLADGVDVVLEVLARAHDEVLADLVEPLRGDRLERASHDRVVLEHRVELVDGQREQAAVGLGAHARHAPSVRQQTDLCVQTSMHNRTAATRVQRTDEFSSRSYCGHSSKTKMSAAHVNAVLQTVAAGKTQRSRHVSFRELRTS